MADAEGVPAEDGAPPPADAEAAPAEAAPPQGVPASELGATAPLPEDFMLPPLRMAETPRGKKGGWRPKGKWDSSTSRLERTTAVYDPVDDKHLRREFRVGIRKTVHGLADARSHQYERDQHRLIEQAYKAAETGERNSQLKNLADAQPYLFKRTWELWPSEEKYYPTTINAGGADLCPIRRRMVVVPPKHHVPCESLSTTGLTHEDFEPVHHRYTPYAVDSSSVVSGHTARLLSPSATARSQESEWGRSTLSKFSSLSGLTAGSRAFARRRTVCVPPAMS